ncbi:membrane protein [Psychroserpens damuponensis]|uniref:membrane protein n=1 Tax=Psychroserpens damuponensis TaxID=943936 RepID=UPI00058F40B0|nr:membrane protein [Psychroserpens damuponensis]
MIKKLVIVLVTFFAIQSYGQEGTASPYSFYGIGSLKFKGTVENRSMGGLSIYTDSIHVNLRNPAAYVGPDLTIWNNENRPVKFSIGASHNSTNLEANSGEAEVSSTTFDYLALSMPVGKFGFGIGLVPYTSVGYKLEDTNDDVITNRYSGDGGVNRAFFGLGYKITDKLSLGVDMNYNFGNIQNSAIEFVYDEGELVQYQTRENNRSDLSGLNFNIGLTYKTMINDKLELQAGLTYSPKSDLSSLNERSFSTIVISSQTGQEFVINEVEGNLEAQNLDETELTLPSRFSFGAGIGKPRAWFIGAEYTTQNTSDFSNPIVSIENTNFVNASNLSFGGFYIPNYNSFGSYWKRVTYRAGVRFENTGLEINDETINEFGMSFGVGLPVGNVFSNANLGVEFGKRGTTNQNLIQENFFRLQISLSLNDRWFEKRKYN